MKNRFVAAFLAIFLGWLWFHKFYLGKWGQWIIYIIFMPITVFISILEGLLYLLNTKSHFDIKYNAEWIKTQNELDIINWKK